jgi:hypothetical protein
MDAVHRADCPDFEAFFCGPSGRGPRPSSASPHRKHLLSPAQGERVRDLERRRSGLSSSQYGCKVQSLRRRSRRMCAVEHRRSAMLIPCVGPGTPAAGPPPPHIVLPTAILPGYLAADALCASATQCSGRLPLHFHAATTTTRRTSSPPYREAPASRFCVA